MLCMADHLLTSLLCRQRLKEEQKLKVPDAGSGTVISEPFEEDRLRITLSAPVRRMQQKTQLFPLDVRTSSRSRLTHSLEVQLYSRKLIKLLCEELKILKEREFDLILVAENAALLHDIGNPPFGHFGEILIADFSKNAALKFSDKMSESEAEDLSFFNGNAQGLRVTATIQDLNLTLAQLSAMMKYPFLIQESDDPFFKGRAGAFLSEQPVLEAVRKWRGTKSCHPLALIVELCDDLAYTLADLEDAFDNMVLGNDLFFKFLDKLLLKLRSPRFKMELCKDKLRPYFAKSATLGVHRMREVIAGAYLNDASSAFLKNFNEVIKTGSVDLTGFESALILDELKKFESAEVYGSLHVQSLELKGASYLKTLFTSFGQLLEPDEKTFFEIINNAGGDAVLTRLARRISRRPKEVYLRALREGEFSERYLRIRLICDYISGMTDIYAAKECAILSGTEPI